MKKSKEKKKACGKRKLSPSTNPLHDPKLQEFRDAGLVDDLQVRNVKIREEYSQLKRKLKDFEAIEILAKKYCLAEDSIKSILYRKRKKKKVYIP